MGTGDCTNVQCTTRKKMAFRQPASSLFFAPALFFQEAAMTAIDFIPHLYYNLRMKTTLFIGGKK